MSNIKPSINLSCLWELSLFLFLSVLIKTAGHVLSPGQPTFIRWGQTSRASFFCLFSFILFRFICTSLFPSARRIAERRIASFLTRVSRVVPYPCFSRTQKRSSPRVCAPRSEPLNITLCLSLREVNVSGVSVWVIYNSFSLHPCAVEPSLRKDKWLL